MLYDKVCIVLENSKQAISNMKDSDEKKLNAFLSIQQNSLTLADLKIFAPFAINLDPYLKKLVQEIFAENPLYNFLPNNRPVTPSTSNRPNNVTAPTATTTAAAVAAENKSKLSELSVDGVISLLKQIDGFDQKMIDQYSNTLRSNNINGKVLANCSPNDLDDLKNVLKFTFGDWLLFKKVITENKQLTHLHTLAPALLPTTASPYQQNKFQQQLSIQIEPTTKEIISAANQPVHPLQTILQPLMQSVNPTDTNSNQLFQEILMPPSNLNYLVLPNKQSNLEKQATMEEQCLQSGIVEDDEENSGDDFIPDQMHQPIRASNSNEDDNEVDVLYLKNSTKVSPSVSLVEESSNDNSNLGLSEYIPLIEKPSRPSNI